jgi:hypothetical protein
MELNIRFLNKEDAVIWDLFCEKTLQGTFLHTRKFLSYHQDRFIDQSLVIFDGEKWLGIFPAALNPKDTSQVVSHPGITYGGILHQGGLRGEAMIEALRSIQDFYARLGFKSLVYKATPSFYHRSPAQDDLYALFRLGANKIRCDLSSTIDLENRLPIIKGRRWGLKKAQKSNLNIVHGSQYLEHFWEILTNNLSEKHEASPVHSLSEIKALVERFPGEILCVCAEYDGVAVAGVILFAIHKTLHTQYIASNAVGREVSAVDAVIEHSISLGIETGKRWFDFGISNENNGLILNDSLYTYKNGFGGGGYTHDFYQLFF